MYQVYERNVMHVCLVRSSMLEVPYNNTCICRLSFQRWLLCVVSVYSPHNRKTSNNTYVTASIHCYLQNVTLNK